MFIDDIRDVLHYQSLPPQFTEQGGVIPNSIVPSAAEWVEVRPEVTDEDIADSLSRSLGF